MTEETKDRLLYLLDHEIPYGEDVLLLLIDILEMLQESHHVLEIEEILTK